jgi:hypothetical protein
MVMNECVRFGGHVDIEVGYKSNLTVRCIIGDLNFA